MLKILLLLILLSLTIEAKHLHHERYYQTQMCNAMGGKMEVVLKDRTRVDCLTEKYAIEVDFAKKWAESIGQSLYYAYMTDRKPAIGLIINLQTERRYLTRVKTMCEQYGITLFLIVK